MKKNKILEYLSSGGLLPQKIQGFKPRQQQIDLTSNIIDALSERKVALLEAGTGVGKTFSYLLPILCYAHTEKKKIAISTHTIQLQEQLLKKDLPRLLDILGFDLQVDLVLGMNNYLCLKRLSEQSSLPEEIAFFSETTVDGRRPPFIQKEAWEEIRVDTDLCTGPRCSHFKECFFFKERDRIKNSQILIFNHHLLISELLSKREKNYDWIIVDEAHHFEEVVRSIQAKKLNYLDLIKIYSKLNFEGKEIRYLIDLPVLKREGLLKAKYFFDHIHFLLHSDERVVLDGRLKKQIEPQGRELLDYIKQFLTFIATAEKKEETQGFTERLTKYYETLKAILYDPEDLNEVCWISSRNGATEITLSKLNVSDTLKDHLFKEEKGIVFLSATLASSNNFDFLKERLGIGEKTVEGIYPSPFNWEKQALFLVTKDLPNADAPDFLQKACETILESVKATYGHALILFTSYATLSAFYDHLDKPLRNLKYTPIKQGERGKQETIELFKESRSPILFGTDSFWEGIDIVGDQLRLVIIVKLPFKVPDEPIVQAISKKMKAEKKDPFFNYFLPQAVVKFKQGFGRLIRHHEDRGVVLCLDHRAVTKGYGKRFLSILPECPKEEVLMKEVKERIKRFFKNGA